MSISGRCLCGNVSYRSEGPARFQVKCYCTDCRKVSAAGHAAMMGFASDDVKIVGDVTEYPSKSDSGADVSRSFCPRCGSGVYASNSTMPGMIFLRASTLDDPNVFTPQFAVYASRAPAWDPVSTDVPAFPERPPSQ